MFGGRLSPLQQEILHALAGLEPSFVLTGGSQGFVVMDVEEDRASHIENGPLHAR